MVESYKDLQVWQKSMELVKRIYRLTQHFPKEELYGLTSQLRRSAVSIPSNLAEGSSKRSTKEFMRFINISYGSLCELETQILIACDLEYIESQTKNECCEKISEIGRMLNGLLRALNKKLIPIELRTLNSEL